MSPSHVLLQRLLHTLDDLASLPRQREYKRKVPFVHIPIELSEQWASHLRDLERLDWYAALFLPEELGEIDRLDQLMDETFAGWARGQVPDVPDVHAEPAWLRLVEAMAGLARLVERVRDRLPPAS